MKLASQILATHTEIDTFLFIQLNNALNDGDQQKVQAITEKRILTDNAFFVLLWGQIENEINEHVTAMIEKGKADPNFEKRRLYYNLDPDRMKFEDRLALVADKQPGSGSAWKKTISYYGLRNNIAHGNSNRSGVSFATVIQDFYQIQSQLVP